MQGHVVGTALVVSCEEMHQGVRAMGLVKEPATLAEMRRLLKEGAIDHAETIVLMNTGMAYK